MGMRTDEDSCTQGTGPEPEPQQRLGKTRQEVRTFYVGEGAERSSGTAACLLHIVALGGLVDL